MELHSSSFSILLLSLFSLFLFTSLIIRTKKANSISSKLPPGPPKLPKIGNLHNLIGSPLHRVLRGLSEKYGPLMHLQLGKVPMVVVSSPEMAEEVMKTHNVLFASRPVTLLSELLSYRSRNIGFTPYGEYWRQIWKICTLELLRMKRVQSFANVRREEYSELVRWLASNAGSPVNLSEKILSTSHGNVSRVLFGDRSKDHAEFISVIKEVLNLSSGFIAWDMLPSYELKHVTREMTAYLQRVHKMIDRIVEGKIQDHKDKLGRRESNLKHDEDCDDLVDVLLKYERNEDSDSTLTMESVKAVILDIFVAGSNTSAITVDWAFAEMIRNPAILAKAQAEVRMVFEAKGRVEAAELVELKYLNMVIKETLRMHPPVALIPRECREKCKINGYKIPAKTMVTVNAWAINRDHRYWNDAEKFDPERFCDSSVDFKGNNFEYIPFGAGRRICPGMNFGIGNIELPLAMLLYHFDWELPDGLRNEGLDMTETFSLFGKRKNDLYMIPKVNRALPTG